MKWLLVILLARAVLGSNPEENQNSHRLDLFEGDMIITRQQRYHAEHGEDVDSDRKRGSSKLRLWPNGILVYEFDPSLATQGRTAAREGMAEMTSKTCIRFRQRTNEFDYVSFQNKERGCYSYVGRRGGKQPINLSSGCWRRGTAVHEIAHALGFFHEQSRPDRDNYVQIIWANIEQRFRRNFNKYPRSTIDSLGTPYDYESVMHYGERFFSTNGGLTIRPLQSGVRIGQRNGLSRIDAQQANLLYKCNSSPSRPRPPPPPPRPPAVCENKSSVCLLFGSNNSVCRFNVVKENCKKLCNNCGV